MNINGILIGSEHPGPMVEYYTKLFGTPQWDESGYTGWQIGSGAITISAHDQVKGKNAQPGRFIWNIESDDVRGEFERFKAAGAIVVTEPYELGMDTATATIATFADPDGNYFQLVTPIQM